jgi:hypothetical protein
MDNRTELQSKQTKKIDETLASMENLTKKETKRTPYIEKASKAARDFLSKTLNVSDLKIIKSRNINNKWVLEAEVFEESSFIKSLGLPTKVKDRNIYSVCLKDNFEVEYYERLDQFHSSN